MWKVNRAAQMGRFVNEAIVSVGNDGDLGREDNHTHNTVTPEQVIWTFYFEDNKYKNETWSNDFSIGPGSPDSRNFVNGHFQLFAYREANRIVDPGLGDEEYMTGWINNAISRGLSRDITRRVRECAERFGHML